MGPQKSIFQIISGLGSKKLGFSGEVWLKTILENNEHNQEHRFSLLRKLGFEHYDIN